MKETFQRGKNPADRNHEDETKRLQAKIGELVVERDFLAGAFDRSLHGPSRPGAPPDPSCTLTCSATFGSRG